MKPVVVEIDETVEAPQPIEAVQSFPTDKADEARWQVEVDALATEPCGVVAETRQPAEMSLRLPEEPGR